MPTHCGQKDSKGYFCRWGSSGKKYYYKKGDKQSMARARAKADAQGRAAHASGYKGTECNCIYEILDTSLDKIKKHLDNIRKNL